MAVACAMHILLMSERVPDGREVFSNVPGGRLHLHKVYTGKPKHWLLCFNLLLVLQSHNNTFMASSWSVPATYSPECRFWLVLSLTRCPECHVLYDCVKSYMPKAKNLLDDLQWAG